MSAHIPVRPTWMCAGCGQNWPCPTRRHELTAEFAGSSVCMSLYLASCMIEASQSIPAAPAGDLYYRFIGWIRN